MATGGELFPELTPSSRSFSPGDYLKSTFEAQNGAKTFIRYSNKRVNATLTLGFSNLSDSDAKLIIDNYVLTNENWDDADEKTRWVVFSSTRGLGGADTDLASYMMPSGLRWRYTQAPEVTSVYPGISNVSCSFVACLDAP